MKHSRKVLVMLVAFALCAVFTVCGSAAGIAEGKAASAAKAPDIGIIAWSTGMGNEYEFVTAVQTILSEQYPDQIEEVFVANADQDAAKAHVILETLNAMWAGDNIAILIVNDENGFDDAALLGFLQDAEKAGMIAGVDHAIDGAPESAFVYDASDPAGCVATMMENALK